MIDYLISDLHLGHSNIIGLCDRPFETVEEMDSELINNWNTTVDPSETVLFLGDLAMASKNQQKEYLEQLNGDIIFIQGNHDDLTMQSGVGPIYDGLEFSIHGIQFYATHYPLSGANTPRRVFHGHTHNNEMFDHPFYNPKADAFNFSAELIGYTPVPIKAVLDIIQGSDSGRLSEYTDHI
jgi:calcineurin-like phosphoesterase family protein